MKKLTIILITITSLLTINIDPAKANKLIEINDSVSKLPSTNLTSRQQSLISAIAEVNNSYMSHYQTTISPSPENVLEMVKLIGATEREIEFVAQIMQVHYQLRYSKN